MGNFNRGGGNRFGGDSRGRGGFGGRGGKPSFGRKPWEDRGPKEMHQATCAECGNICEVPFRPTGEKPVFCRECFAKNGGPSDRAPRRDFSNKGDFNKPKFGGDRPGGSFNSGNVEKQIAELGSKIDRLIKAVEALNPVKASEKVVPQEVLESKEVEMVVPVKPKKTKKAKK